MNIISSMRHTITCAVSKKAHSRKPLAFVSMLVMAYGLLVGCPDPTSNTPRPNLTITSFSIDNTSVIVGRSFTATVVVQNSGNAPSPATRVSFVLLDSANMPAPLTGTLRVPEIEPGAATSLLTQFVIVPDNTPAGTYRVRATVAAVENESDRDDNTFLLGGDSPTEFTVIVPRTTTFNIAHGCLVLIGDFNCGIVRSTSFMSRDIIGTVESPGATKFSATNSSLSSGFRIDSNGRVTADPNVSIGALGLPRTFDINVTGGMYAGRQRVRIINDPGADGIKRSETAQIGTPVATAGVTLFTPTTSTARTFACRGQGSGCVTSYQTMVGAGDNRRGWHAPYSLGTAATALDVSAYSEVFITYQLNNNTVSGAPPAQFTLRLGDAYFNLTAADNRLVATSTWRTIPISLSKSPSSGTFSSSEISNIGFYNQGNGIDLSIRTLFFR